MPHNNWNYNVCGVARNFVVCPRHKIFYKNIPDKLNSFFSSFPAGARAGICSLTVLGAPDVQSKTPAFLPIKIAGAGVSIFSFLCRKSFLFLMNFLRFSYDAGMVHPMRSLSHPRLQNLWISSRRFSASRLPLPDPAKILSRLFPPALDPAGARW